MSIVEEALREQPRLWREISRRATEIIPDLPMDQPRRILLVGVGSSYYAARLTGLALQKGQRLPRAQILSCSSMAILGGEVKAERGDWVLAFSHRGRTPVTLRALEQCQQAGAYGILVAGVGAPNEVARAVLSTSPLERVEPHTMSVTGAIAAVTSLLLGGGGGSILEEWDYLATRCADFDLDRLKERAGKGPSVILGEWEGEWIAREGALKLMEMAQLPVRAFGSEEFFHGPHHSVGKGDAIWVCETHRDARHGEIHPALRVSVSTSTPISWVPALVELQWLSLAVAQNLGQNPDR
jgi:fructoselysine-6-P-deglycase FrlB-like protein